MFPTTFRGCPRICLTPPAKATLAQYALHLDTTVANLGRLADDLAGIRPDPNDIAYDRFLDDGSPSRAIAIIVDASSPPPSAADIGHACPTSPSRSNACERGSTSPSNLTTGNAGRPTPSGSTGSHHLVVAQLDRRLNKRGHKWAQGSRLRTARKVRFIRFMRCMT